MLNKTLNKLLELSLLVCTASAMAGDFKLQPFTTSKLANGLTVYLMARHDVPLVSVQVTVLAGAARDGKQAGVANLTADALVLGSQRFDKKTIDDSFDFRGGLIGGSGGLEASDVSANFASADTATFLPMLADIVQHPRFPDAEVAKLRAHTVDDLKHAKESPRDVVHGYFNKLLYGNGVYGNPTEGTAKTVAMLKRADLVAFHQRYYRPELASIAVVGDFDPAVMQTQIETLFGHWQGSGATPAALPASPIKADKARVLLVNKADSVETTLMFGGAGVARGDPDFIPLQVINTVLGGRFTSWLNDELRVNSGLTYGARSSFAARRQNGTFAVSTFTSLPKTEAALTLAMETYQRLWTKGIDAATLESAKAYVKGQFPPNYETHDQLAGLLGQMFIHGFGAEQIDTFSQKVDSLTVEQAKALIDQHFPRDKLQMVLIGKAEAIRSIAAKYGDVTELDIKADGFGR